MRRALVLIALCFGSSGCSDNLTLPPDRDPAADPDPPVLDCIPNLDETIDASELLAAEGVPVRYVVSPSGTSRSVDLDGEEIDGERVWDFATDYADDEALTVVVGSLEARWYASSFPSGAFTTPFNRSGSLESVGRISDGAFQLLGLASRDEEPDEGQTLLVYEPPITVLRLPVEVGDSFVSTGEITGGVLQGLPYAGRDTYEVSVDAIGRIDLLQYTFEQVHRVRTKVTVEPAVGASAVRYQTSFFAECFAEVARAVSEDGATSADFTEAAELRRLGF